ncbi:TPA_asm: LO5 [Tilapia adomavirus 2]|uniref:LO5 n=1 Tax=Tilapia adomavirus 2 TaxID=2597804 RepID=A0A5H3CW25_9VIRU|nr:TPA_asm: LO5 [Tilapia adomavirus 2]
MATRDLVSLSKNPGGLGFTYLATFDDNEMYNTCVLDLSRTPVLCPRGESGQGLAAISVASVTVTNTAITLGDHLHNNIIDFNGLEAVPIPEYSIDDPETLCKVLGYLGLPHTITDHGRITYTGTSAYSVPRTFVDGFVIKPIPHTLIEMLGFQNATTAVFGKIQKTIIVPGHEGANYPDVKGPLRDLIITCEQVQYTKDSQQAVAVCSPSSRFGKPFAKDCTEYARNLDIPGGRIDRLVFHIEDASKRPVKFAFGVPLISLRILPLTDNVLS